jgi:hypothetical protein
MMSKIPKPLSCARCGKPLVLVLPPGDKGPAQADLFGPRRRRPDHVSGGHGLAGKLQPPRDGRRR